MPCAHPKWGYHEHSKISINSRSWADTGTCPFCSISQCLRDIAPPDSQVYFQLLLNSCHTIHDKSFTVIITKAKVGIYITYSFVSVLKKMLYILQNYYHLVLRVSISQQQISKSDSFFLQTNRIVCVPSWNEIYPKASQQSLNNLSSNFWN